VSPTDNIYTQDAIDAGTQVTDDVARAARARETVALLDGHSMVGAAEIHLVSLTNRSRKSSF
jgi:hypothetical protein